jgi:hypothetical protein
MPGSDQQRQTGKQGDQEKQTVADERETRGRGTEKMTHVMEITLAG